MAVAYSDLCFLKALRQNESILSKNQAGHHAKKTIDILNETRNKEGLTPLIVAVKNGNEDFVKRLIDMSSPMDIGAIKVGRLGSDKLYTLAPEVYFYLMHHSNETGAKKFALAFLYAYYQMIHLDKSSYLLLHAATLKNEVGLVKVLIARGWDANAQDSFGNTALHIAGHESNHEMIDALIAGGAKDTVLNHEKITPRQIIKAREKEHIIVLDEEANGLSDPQEEQSLIGRKSENGNRNKNNEIAIEKQGISAPQFEIEGDHYHAEKYRLIQEKKKAIQNAVPAADAPFQPVEPHLLAAIANLEDQHRQPNWWHANYVRLQDWWENNGRDHCIKLSVVSCLLGSCGVLMLGGAWVLIETFTFLITPASDSGTDSNSSLIDACFRDVDTADLEGLGQIVNATFSGGAFCRSDSDCEIGRILNNGDTVCDVINNPNGLVIYTINAMGGSQMQLQGSFTLERVIWNPYNVTSYSGQEDNQFFVELVRYDGPTRQNATVSYNTTSSPERHARMIETEQNEFYDVIEDLEDVVEEFEFYDANENFEDFYASGDTETDFSHENSNEPIFQATPTQSIENFGAALFAFAASMGGTAIQSLSSSLERGLITDTPDKSVSFATGTAFASPVFEMPLPLVAGGCFVSGVIVVTLIKFVINTAKPTTLPEDSPVSESWFGSMRSLVGSWRQNPVATWEPAPEI